MLTLVAISHRVLLSSEQKARLGLLNAILMMIVASWSEEEISSFSLPQQIRSRGDTPEDLRMLAQKMGKSLGEPKHAILWGLCGRSPLP